MKYDWDKFNPSEYVMRNYGKTIFIEDKQIIKLIIAYLQSSGIQKHSLIRIADFGVGPNLYPSMLMEPYIPKHGVLELLDISKPNLEYLHKTIIGTSDIWNRFETLMESIGGEAYTGVFERLRRIVRIKKQSIYDIQTDSYDAVLSFFSTESILDSKKEFISVINMLLTSLRPHGLLISAHMLGSNGYSAGAEQYPSVYLTMDDLNVAYKNINDLHLYQIHHTPDQAIRNGYTGMALVIGRK